MTNVALLVLDTVRKDYFDDHSPRLRDLADMEFHRCYAPSSWSVPSHASMFSGLLPSAHGVHSFNPNYADLETTFLETLGHKSIGLSANGAVSESFGAQALFDTFESFAGNDERSFGAVSFGDVSDQKGLGRYLSYLSAARKRGVLAESILNGLYIKLNERLRGSPLPKFGDFGASAVVDRALSLTSDEPFFLFANFIDAHGPMENLRVLDSEVPYSWSSRDIPDEMVRDASQDELEDYLRNYRNLYAANIKYLDDKLATFVERLQERTSQETVVIVTADHGEELRYPGERDLGHMDFSAPLLHVPFVVIGAEGPKENGLTSLLDIGEIVRTVTESGTVPDVSRNRVPGERFGMLFYDGEDEYWTRGVRTIFEGDIRYEWDTLGRSRRIEVETSRDGISQDVDPPDHLRAVFDGSLESVAASNGNNEAEVNVDSETIRQLEDLGYRI